MLHLAFLSSPDQKKKYIDDFLIQVKSGATPTWIVSDLRNKFEVQNFILQQQDFFEDLHVLRASELWRFLFKKTHPDWKLISNEFLKTWIRDRLRKNPEALSALSSSQSDQVVYDMMNLMAPLLAHPLGKTRMREWFSQNPASLQRWGGWYLLAEELFEALSQKKRTSLYWLSGFLQSDSTDWEVFWKRPLIFDLGSQMSQVEAELIKSLGQKHQVLVLAPQFESEADFDYLQKPYAFLQSHASKIEKTSPSLKEKSSFETLRFSAPLAEVKKACSQVRQWLDQGISASKIAVIAPDVEQYWPLLDPMLGVEGIPVAKDRMSRLQSFPAVAEWISQMRVMAKDFSYADLEMASYAGEKPELRFEEFYSLFSEMLTEVDLKRHQNIEKAFKADFSIHEEIAMEEFIGVSLKFWRDRSNFSYLEICIRELMAHAEMNISMTVSSWISYLSQITAKKEICILRGHNSGVQVTNLSSADSVRLSHRIFLGLTESMVQNHRKSMLSSEEISSISRDIGFDLSHPEASTDEFDLEWLSHNVEAHDVYSFPQTGFSGSAEAPSALWLSQGGGEHLNVPEPTVWESVKTNINDLASFGGDERVEQDLGIRSLPPLKLIKEIPLSPSSIEAYRKCAFIFTSQKLFRLMDFPILDLDVDRRTKGLLAHAMLEQMGREPRQFEYSDEALREILESLREPLGLGSMDEFVWQSIKEKHVGIAQRYLSFETAWKKRYPETEVVAVEAQFEFNFKDNWKIRGKIDRIDRDQQGHLAVIDYKVSPGDFKNYTSWLKNNQIQLGLYMLAIESQALPQFPDNEVVGAFYYVLKNMNRDKGLKVKEMAGSLFELDRKKNSLSLEEKKKLLKDIAQYVAETVQFISEGKIDPLPLDPNDCVTCQWRSLCRAPHLN